MLAELPDHPANKIDEVLPWNWKATGDRSSNISHRRGGHRSGRVPDAYPSRPSPFYEIIIPKELYLGTVPALWRD
jgi:hypothetical protein